MLVKDLWEVAAQAFEAPRFRTPHDVQRLCSPHNALNPPHLKAIDEALLDVMEGRCDRLLISLPAQEGKSERAIRAMIPWWLHHRPSDRIAVASFEKSTAERWGGFTRDDIERHGAELGLRIRQDSRARGAWTLEAGPGGQKNGGVYCVGVGGPITGRAVDLMLIDDPVKGRAWVESLLYRDRQYDWLINDVRTRLGANSKMIGIMTRWHSDDLFGRILASPEGHRYRVLNIPAIAEENDPIGRAPGQPLQSVRGRTLEDYETTRETVGPYVWSSLYQGHPTVADGVLFKRSDLRYWHKPMRTPSQFGEAFDLVPDVQDPDHATRVYLRDCFRFMTVDLAASTKTSADFTVAAVWALTLSGDLLLLDLARARVEQTQHGKLVEPLARRYAVDYVGVEDSGRSVNLVAELAAAGIAVRPLKADADKVTRALPATARVARHQLWLPADAPWLDAYVGELIAFPDAPKDDQVDVTAYACREVSRSTADVVAVPAQRYTTDDDLGGVGLPYAAPSDTDWTTIEW